MFLTRVKKKKKEKFKLNIPEHNEYFSFKIKTKSFLLFFNIKLKVCEKTY